MGEKLPPQRGESRVASQHVQVTRQEPGNAVDDNYGSLVPITLALCARRSVVGGAEPRLDRGEELEDYGFDANGPHFRAKAVAIRMDNSQQGLDCTWIVSEDELRAWAPRTYRFGVQVSDPW